MRGNSLFVAFSFHSFFLCFLFLFLCTDLVGLFCLLSIFGALSSYGYLFLVMVEDCNDYGLYCYFEMTTVGTKNLSVDNC